MQEVFKFWNKKTTDINCFPMIQLNKFNTTSYFNEYAFETLGRHLWIRKLLTSASGIYKHFCNSEYDYLCRYSINWKQSLKP